MLCCVKVSKQSIFLGKKEATASICMFNVNYIIMQLIVSTGCIHMYFDVTCTMQPPQDFQHLHPQQKTTPASLTKFAGYLYWED